MENQIVVCPGAKSNLSPLRPWTCPVELLERCDLVIVNEREYALIPPWQPELAPLGHYVEGPRLPRTARGERRAKARDAIGLFRRP